MYNVYIRPSVTYLIRVCLYSVNDYSVQVYRSVSFSFLYNTFLLPPAKLKATSVLFCEFQFFNTFPLPPAELNANSYC